MHEDSRVSKTFIVDGVIEMVKAQLDNEISMNYGFVSVGGVDIFAIEVAESDKKDLAGRKVLLYMKTMMLRKWL